MNRGQDLSEQEKQKKFFEKLVRNCHSKYRFFQTLWYNTFVRCVCNFCEGILQKRGFLAEECIYDT